MIQIWAGQYAAPLQCHLLKTIQENSPTSMAAHSHWDTHRSLWKEHMVHAAQLVYDNLSQMNFQDDIHHDIGLSPDTLMRVQVQLKMSEVKLQENSNSNSKVKRLSIYKFLSHSAYLLVMWLCLCTNHLDSHTNVTCLSMSMCLFQYCILFCTSPASHKY